MVKWKFFSNYGCLNKENVIWPAHLPPVSYAASEGAVHQLHQGAAVQGVFSGPHAAVQWSGPRGWGHSAASRSHLPGHTSQHRPVQLGEVQHNVCVFCAARNKGTLMYRWLFLFEPKVWKCFLPHLLDELVWPRAKKMLCSIQLLIRLIFILTVLPFRKQEE